ncbi:FAD-dependent oxidoreductase [Streptomyces sp. OE57]|uniref:FAD-dependent oxidoreductase n=1 Tax=Streptomyces lacaronensis TaxID=3379885 RepID=UPI0039B78FC1
MPSKMTIRAANLLAEAGRVPFLAGDVEVTPDWIRVAGRIRGEATGDWNDQVAADRLAAKGGRLVRGTGRLTGPRQVTVGGRTFRARQGMVLATGTRPRIPPVPGLASTSYWTNRDAMPARELPVPMIVLGGGAIGVKLAQVFARFRCTVTVVERQNRLLSQEEPEAGQLADRVLWEDGVTVLTSTRVRQVGHDGTGFTIRLEGEQEPLRVERVLVATGHRADLAALGVDAAGLDPSARAVRTNGQMRAGEGLRAIGDVTGHGNFTHVSMYQADIAARDILRTSVVPIASSTCGGIHGRGDEGFIKLIEDSDRGVLIGATSAGPAGGEVLYGLNVAVHAEIAVEHLRHMIYTHPTFHRTVEAALGALR